MTFPLCNQADLFTAGPRLQRERQRWDKEGFERTERRNGACQCPKCGLWWPVIEEPCTWVDNGKSSSDTTSIQWLAIGWEGFPICLDCRLLIVDQPDGTGEVYQL